MPALLTDLKSASRALSREPSSAAMAVVVLTIGIGLCSFMFSIIYGIYFRGMDVPEAERVLVVWSTDLEGGRSRTDPSIHDLADWRARQTSFESLLGFYSGTVNVSGSTAPIRFYGSFVSANMFDVLRVGPLLGRGFAPGDDAPGAPMNLVLSFSAWRDHFGMDRGVIGREIRVNGEPGTVLGVMPEGFAFPSRSEVWVPFRDDPSAIPRGEGRSASVYGRLRQGVTRERAATELSAIAAQLAVEHRDTNEGRGVRLETPVEANMEPTLNLIFGSMMVAVFLVLLVACANVGSLLLARAAMRTKEAGIRVAMGGGTLRVMLPFLAEALVLATLAAVVGVLIATVGVDWFDQATDPARTGRPWFMQFEVDGPILLFVLGITVLTALAAGVAPSWRTSRTDVNVVLKDESRGSSSLHIGRLSRVLVTTEVALSCALLVGAGLMTKSILNVGRAEYPYLTDEVFTARVGLFESDYPSSDDRNRFWFDVLAELRATAEVEAAGLTTALPHNGANRLEIAIEGTKYAEARDLPRVSQVMVSPGYFEALGTSVLGGRDFSDQDDLDSELVAIVNQPMVDRHFGGESPIGRRFREGGSDTLPAITIVGVVPDLDVSGASSPFDPDFEPSGYYIPLRQHDAQFVSVAAQAASGDVNSLANVLRAAVRRVDPDVPIYYPFTQAEVIDRSNWFFSVFGAIFIIFGAAALFMASVGLYGVLSFAVSRRTQEMGIRVALGAQAHQVVALVVRQGTSYLAAGLGVGLLLAFGLTRLIGVLMYEVDPHDPMVFGAVVGVIATVGAGAAFVPAWRATKLTPLDALRSQ